MELILPFRLQPYPFHISYEDRILMIGSCFSDEIGNRLKELKCTVLRNPNGILYDPYSIRDALLSYIHNKPYEARDLAEINGLWHSWKHHSAFSGPDREEVLEYINRSRQAAHSFLKEATVLIITLGTAYCYRLAGEENYPVSNCHKAPAHFFKKDLPSASSLTDALNDALTALSAFRPSIRVILTVSPVKHIRDGVVENNRSKARLIEAVHTLAEQHEHVFYFPSYEIVTDVLRDYRFYKSDLVHPNEQATDYVFECFMNAFFTETDKKLARTIRQIQRSVHHKPFFAAGDAHRRFVASLLREMEAMESRYPFIDFLEEKSTLQARAL